jgi:hypothetical protein
MFNWYRQWRRSRSRAVFRFWDGFRWRYADPLEAIFALHVHPEYNYRKHPFQADRGNHEAIAIIATAVSDALDVPAFNEKTMQGLTITERLQVFVDLNDYLARQKKSTDETPIYLEPTEEESTSSDCEPETTNSTSDCGSTSTDKS